MSISLVNTKIGEKVIVKKVLNENSIKRRLLDIGLTPGTVVERILENFHGNLVAYMIRGALIAIRNEDAEKIMVEVI
ncbi:MAG: ferrous iron transport protein A [Bacilli bacterium]